MFVIAHLFCIVTRAIGIGRRVSLSREAANTAARLKIMVDALDIKIELLIAQRALAFLILFIPFLSLIRATMIVLMAKRNEMKNVKRFR